MFDIKFDVVSERSDIPAVKIGHLEEHTDLAVLPDKAFKPGDQVLIIVVRRLAADPHFKDLPVAFSRSTLPP